MVSSRVSLTNTRAYAASAAIGFTINRMPFGAFFLAGDFSGLTDKESPTFITFINLVKIKLHPYHSFDLGLIQGNTTFSTIEVNTEYEHFDYDPDSDPDSGIRDTLIKQILEYSELEGCSLKDLKLVLATKDDDGVLDFFPDASYVKWLTEKKNSK